MTGNRVRRINYKLLAGVSVGLAVLAAIVLVFGGKDVVGCFGVTGC